MFATFLWLTLAHAAEFFAETSAVAERPAAQSMQEVAKAAGFEGRVVRRFHLGRGWEFVLLVEHFGSEADATAAAARLSKDLGHPVTVYRFAELKAVAIDAPNADTPPAPATGIGELLAQVEAAHGGAGGGSDGLARAAAVHFVYTRALKIGGKDAVVRHDYWRDGAARRLVVETGGAATDSTAIVNRDGAWIRVGAAVEKRDIGVLLGSVDAFAPEPVLMLALDVRSLLAGPELQRFKVLDGAESGVRMGEGGDETEPGLAFMDVDPATGRLLRARYVTEAGPVTYEYEGWREVAPGMLVPAAVRIERADGRKETLKVEILELAAQAPTGTFSPPG